MDVTLHNKRRRRQSDVAGVSMPAADLEAETERLLDGRMRDIKLSSQLLKLYQERSWPQRSKIVRSWTLWTILLNLMVVCISSLVIPAGLWLTIPLIGGVIPMLSAGVFLIWRRPKKPWIEGLSIFLLVLGCMAAYGFVGLAAGGADAERYMTGSLFVATIAIILFAVEPAWTTAMGLCCPLVYLAFQLLNPTIEASKAFGSTLFYGIGIVAVVAARHHSAIILQKNFLMSLRNDYRSEALTLANRQLETLATRDPLTGLPNRRFAADQIEKIWHDSTIPKTGVAFVMADIDHFKKLNDTAGHAAGDDCLSRVAQSIEASVRAERDIVCRHGGEEFLIILNGVTREMARTLAERICSGVEALAIVNPGLDPTSESAGVVTISVGVAFALDEDAEPDLVIKRADESLYDAKQGGRNRAVMAAAPDQRPAPARIGVLSAA